MKTDELDRSRESRVPATLEVTDNLVPLEEVKDRYISVELAGRYLGVGRVKAYEMAREGTIPTQSRGRKLLVPVAALERVLENEITFAEEGAIDSPARRVVVDLQGERGALWRPKYEREMRKAMMMAAANIVEALDDVAKTDSHDWNSPSGLSYLDVINFLPARFVDLYDVSFFSQCLERAKRLYSILRKPKGDPVPNCVMDEILLRAILNSCPGFLLDQGREPTKDDQDYISECFDRFFLDNDFEFLFDERNISLDRLYEVLPDCGGLKFDEWFEPFYPSEYKTLSEADEKRRHFED